MPTSAPTLQAPPTGRYIIDASASTVTFITTHMFGLGKVRGRFAVARGTVVVADRVEDSAANAEISVSSFSTRNLLRDGPVRSALFLNARRHPTISFRADGVHRRRDSWVVAGTLAVKGTSAPVELTVTDIDIKGAAVVFIAHGTVDRYALGVTMMRGMAARHLSVDITAHTILARAVQATARN
jgi:polyisoprenoid-binding protein YceI